MTGSGWLVPSPFKVAHSPRCVCSGSLWRVREWLQYVAVQVARLHLFFGAATAVAMRWSGFERSSLYPPYTSAMAFPVLSMKRAAPPFFNRAGESPPSLHITSPGTPHGAGGFSSPTARSTRAFLHPHRYYFDSYSRLFHKRRDLVSLIFWSTQNGLHAPHHVGSPARALAVD